MNRLSEEEFVRLQEQLLQLRTVNYSLREKSTKQDHEIFNLRNQLSNCNGELSKAQRTISWSKRNREISVLLDENETLKQKLQDQEEEFRIQNQTLMNEFSTVHSKNDALEKEVAKYRNQIDNDCRTDFMRIQAENLALKKKLALVAGSNLNCSNLETITNGIAEDSTNCNEGFENKSNTKEPCCDNIQLLLDTEIEEKKLLASQLSSFQHSINELKGKLKRKQDLIVELQKDKETLYNENRDSLLTLEQTKDKEINELKALCQRTQTQLILAQNSLKEARMKSTDLANMGVRFVVTDSVDGEATNPEDQTATVMDCLNSKVAELEAELCKLGKEMEESKCELSKQVQEVNDLREELAQINKLAEKRKALIDEQAIAIQRHQNEAEEKMKQLISNHKARVDELEQLCDELEASCKVNDRKICKLESVKKKYEEIKAELPSLREEIINLENLNKENTENHEKVIEELKSVHSDAMSSIVNKHEEEIKVLKTQLALNDATRTEYEETIARLKQEVHDSVEERRLHEKKGVTVVKDLQKQLASERKRADKLQERLNEFIVDTNASKSDSLELRPRDPDATSVSSWSLMSGQNEANLSDGTIESLPGSASISSSPTAQGLENETQALLGRVTILQQEKWILEERLTFLEQSSSAMADELLHKNAVIQHYCMEGKDSVNHSNSPLHATNQAIKKVAEFVRSLPGDDLGTREANKKLVNYVQELLTKNMTLEKENENLAQEVVRLSKNLPGHKSVLGKSSLSSGDNADFNEDDVDDYHVITSEDS